MATFQDWENRTITLPAGAAVGLTGARCVYNQIAGSSEDFTNAAWNFWNSGASLSGINEIVFAASSAAQVGQDSNAPLIGGTASKIVAVTAQMRTASGAKGFRIVNIHEGAGVHNSPDLLASVTPTIFSYVVAYSAAAGSGNVRAGLCNSTDAVAGSVICDWIQTEDVTGQSAQVFGGYVPKGTLTPPYPYGANGLSFARRTNANTVHPTTLVVTEATGALLTPANGASAVTTDASGPLGMFGTGAFALTGNDCDLDLPSSLACGAGAFTLSGKDIRMFAPSLDRMWRIPAENRVLRIPAEDRVLRIPAENRVLRIT